MKKILLVCGTGASSGFVAANARKVAKAEGKDYEILARSDSAAEDYIEDASLLLVGPHLDYMLEELEALGAEYDVPVKLIPKDIYGSMDGKGILQLIEENSK